MSTNKRLGTKVPRFADTHRVLGAQMDSGPYLGIVRNNVDPTRSGRLQIWIPDFGGVKDESSHWITVRYASPYMGATRWPRDKTERSKENEYSAVNHTYGMWFNPPDLGNFVLVTFVAGDINRGYWFACVMPELGHHGIPGMAGSDSAPVTPKDAELAKALNNPPYPSVEFNEENESLFSQWSNYSSIPKPIHEEQAKVLLRQGLEDDKTRGVISSSSQRESPSAVFGISTPGQPSSERDPDTLAPRHRLGGHTFVMDDGDYAKTDKLIRLRTAGGHQILMNDTEEVLYISNANGSVWMEFTGGTASNSDAGSLRIFSNNDISIRTKESFNFHADNNINMFAGNSINMFAGVKIREESQTISLKADIELNEYGQKVNISSGSTLNMQAATQGSWGTGTELVFASGMIYLNTQAAPKVEPAAPIQRYRFKDTGRTMRAPYYKWTYGKQLSGSSVVDNAIVSTVDIVPTHEPWTPYHPTAVKQQVFVPTAPVNTPQTSAPKSTNVNVTTKTSTASTPTTGTPAAVTSAPSTSNVGPSTATGKGVSKACSSAEYASQPVNTSGIGPLSANEITALKAQIAKSESNFNYAAENQLGYIGKYQFGALALIDQGYVKPNTSNRGLSNPANWTGKNGLKSKQDFWNSHELQEKIMDVNLTSNYKTLTRIKTIGSDSAAYDVGGKLAVSHLLGAGGCRDWAKGKGGSDANGTTGDTYYNRGRYAVTVLAKSSTPNGTLEA